MISPGNMVSLGVFPLRSDFTGENIQKQSGMMVLGEEGPDKYPIFKNP
jgi:hypothetical protein